MNPVVATNLVAATRKKCNLHQVRSSLPACPGGFIDSRDGQIYKTVTIGSQTWMAENLNYYDVTLEGRSWCHDDENDTAPYNCDENGRLYTWAAAIDSAKLYKEKSIDCGYGKICTLPAKYQGICPSGWHLPTNTDWNTLFDEVGGLSTAGRVLKSQKGWSHYGYVITSGNGTDDFGFTVFPAGIRHDRKYDSEGSAAYFWTSVEINDNYVYSIQLSNNQDDVSFNDKDEYNAVNKYDGISIRCLKD